MGSYETKKPSSIFFQIIGVPMRILSSLDEFAKDTSYCFRVVGDSMSLLKTE